MHRIRSIVVVVAGLALGGATMAFAGSGDSRWNTARTRVGTIAVAIGATAGMDAFASATLMSAAGQTVGSVWMREDRRDSVVQLVARVRNLPPGFHGFHIHTTGRCDAPTFTSAGGHLDPSGEAHGDHAGDLPSLLVNEDGTAFLATATDRFTIGDLRDADGSAVMVHSGRDDFANIPARYGGPDQETLDTGDSGSRIACGVVR